MIADNPSLMEALKGFLLEEFTVNWDNIDTTLSNEMIGQQTRSCVEGASKIQKRFVDIRKYETPPKSDIHRYNGR